MSTNYIAYLIEHFTKVAGGPDLAERRSHALPPMRVGGIDGLVEWLWRALRVEGSVCPAVQLTCRTRCMDSQDFQDCKISSDGSSKAKDLAALSCQSINSTKTNSRDTVFHQHHLPERKYLHNRLRCLLILNAALTLSHCLCEWLGCDSVNSYVHFTRKMFLMEQTRSKDSQFTNFETDISHPYFTLLIAPNLLMSITSCASKCIFALVQVLWNLPSRTKLPSSTTAQYCIWADPLVWMGTFVIAFEAPRQRSRRAFLCACTRRSLDLLCLCRSPCCCRVWWSAEGLHEGGQLLQQR